MIFSLPAGLDDCEQNTGNGKSSSIHLSIIYLAASYPDEPSPKS